MSGRIPPRRSLDQLKQEAKRWLKALRAGASTARDRFDAALPHLDRVPGLRDVQHALARELGFAGWTALKEATEARVTPVELFGTIVSRFLDNACPDHHVRGGSDHLRAATTAMRLLAVHPEISTASLATRIVCGDVDGVRMFLTADAEAINRRDGDIDAPRGGSGSTDDLLHHDLGDKGWTPLLYLAFTRLPLPASNDNAVAIAHALLDAGADPNAYFKAGGSRYTPLVGVIGEGEEGRPAHPHRDELVALLLAGGAEPFDGQVLYNIHFGGHLLWYLELIHRSTTARGTGAGWSDPTWPMLDIWGNGNGARWVLDIAIEHDNVPLAVWALGHGAGANAPPPPVRRNQRAKGSLHEEALRHGSTEIAALLVQHGAAATPVTLSPAENLAGAAFALNGDRVRDLIAAHPELITHPEPLVRAAQRNRVDVIALLLDAGVDINAARPDGETALHHAVYRNHEAAVRALLARGAGVDIRGSNFNNTPLSSAVYSRNEALLELLAPYSGDIWELVYGGQIGRVRQIVAEQPEIAKAAGDGHTLLMWLTPGDEEIALATATLLLAHGADPAPRNRDGMTAADRADRLGMRRLAALLRDAEAREEDPGRPTVVGYDAMAERLLEAYRTGAPAAMEAHYADTWHRREWSAMRRYVLADLGRPEPADGIFTDISLDDARRWIAYDHQFRGWQDLVDYVTALPPGRRSVTRSPVGAARDRNDESERVVARDWDEVIAAIEAHGYPVVHANGQMTDSVLARIAELPQVTTLLLGGSKAVTDVGVRALARMPQLRHLEIGDTQVTDAGIAAIGGLPALEHFSGGMSRITDAAGAWLADCPRLASVDVAWTHTGDGFIAAFAGHAALRHLISGVTVTDAGLARLADIPRFRDWTPGDLVPATFGEKGPASLVLRGSFTDRGLAEVAALRGIYSLSYEGGTGVTSAGLASLAAMPHLGALSGDFHDADLKLLGAFPALRRLGCQDTDATDDGWAALAASRTIEAIWGRRCYGLGSRGFRALATMPALSNLSVSCRNVDDDAIALLPTFPALRELMPMDIPDAGYRHIGQCEQLDKLTLMYCRDTGDEATSHIIGMDRLRRYFASYTRITDRTPQLLATMQGIEEIEFSAIAGISNAGVAALAGAPSLRRLKVGGSPLVTPEVRAAFPGRIVVAVT